MRSIIPLAIIGVVVIGVLVMPPRTDAATKTTLSVQPYQFTLSPQGVVTITSLYYVLDGQHELVVRMASVGANVNITWISSDARTWTTPGGFTVSRKAAWIEIPGWNCGYTDDNGRLETTQIATSTGNAVNLSYPCIYPPMASSIAFKDLQTAPWSDGHGTIVP